MLGTVCRCVKDVVHPTRGNEKLCRTGELLRFAPVAFRSEHLVAVCFRFAHYKLPGYRTAYPYFETWAYFPYSQFNLHFETLELFELEAVDAKFYRSLVFDPLFLVYPPACSSILSSSPPSGRSSG